VTVAVISTHTLGEALMARGATVTNATGYRAEAVDVPLKAGGSQRVAPYWVLHLAPGNPDVELDLGQSVIDGDFLFQITCAGGFPEDVDALTDRVMGTFHRWVPVVAGAVFGPCRPPAGFQAPPVQVDRDFTPHRFFVPLQFTTTATTTT
jgi:hypothetical protein